MTHSDFQACQRILKSYFQRVCHHQSSLLARIYGVYTIRLEEQSPVQVLVMGNTIQYPDKVLGVFDLKGSLVDRKAKESDSIMKDKNLVEINRR